GVRRGCTGSRRWICSCPRWWAGASVPCASPTSSPCSPPPTTSHLTCSRTWPSRSSRTMSSAASFRSCRDRRRPWFRGGGVMKAVVQTVSRASVTVDGEVVGSIEDGLLVLVGVTHDDTEALARELARKVYELRILDDERSASDTRA